MSKKPTIKFKKSVTGGREAVIEKRASNSVADSGLTLGPTGHPGLNIISDVIYEESRTDLRFPQASSTFKKMSYDPTIASALNILDIMIGRVEWKFKAPEDASAQAQEATDFLNWCMTNMEDQTWTDFINEVGSYRVYGYHVAEKIYKQVGRGKWTGKLKWQRLETRSQDTLYKWKFDKSGRALTHAIQDLTRLSSNSGRLFNFSGQSEKEIPRKKFMLFRYDVKRGSPEGNSPLKRCYIPWKYKALIEEYESIGIAKDLGGIPVLGVDVDYLAKAAQNPNGKEAAVVNQMKQDAANLHAGEQTYVLRPVAYNDQGKELFTFDLVGVDGGGKQYNTDDIIRRKQNEILTVFLADVLKLGQDGSGSFALSDNKNNQLALAIQYHLKLISEVINYDLVPQTLALNGWKFEEEDMPQLTFGDLDERDLDILSKFIQRSVSVGAINPTQELENVLRGIAGLPETDYSEAEKIPEGFKSESGSRSGDGMKTPGAGTSNDAMGEDDDSASNSENS